MKIEQMVETLNKIEHRLTKIETFLEIKEKQQTTKLTIMLSVASIAGGLIGSLSRVLF